MNNRDLECSGEGGGGEVEGGGRIFFYNIWILWVSATLSLVKARSLCDFVE